MKVILLERVGRLGTIGDEVTVKDGFARNFLLPSGKALRANEANRARFEAEREEIEKRNAERRDSAMAVAESVNGKTVTIIRQAGETGVLYGSVSARDITDTLAEDNIKVGRSQVELAAPIKAVGLHTVALALHAEVISEITVNVARSQDEAERQAKGEDMSVVSFDEEPQEEEIEEEATEEGAEEAEASDEAEEENAE
ncbi:large subunit ribosomal protein L9 [Maritalea mobilis]|uniref:Large ribosomal subunit protein bL9 n=1 Tax=Maritalea mobilis TaxID=483324 RepID=A0A4R6VJT8_9HYPH|nr:50S ribosomal protein L9 [Maritalea mobilis]TDQ63655.1 large subunit ribosomal protein L9 [Maritalea mobilis]